VADAHAYPLGPIAVVSVTAWPGAGAALAEAVGATFGLDLAAPGRWTRAGDLVCIWNGPGHWHLQRPGSEDLFTPLAAAAGAHAGLIDLGDARVVWRVGGPGARDILARLVPVDLHPRAFAAGDAATSLAGHLSVHLRQVDASPAYDLACPRSYGGSLRRALELAGAGRLDWGKPAGV
jgi:heterotetrameric sarcosine oxidase gamma subunit